VQNIPFPKELSQHKQPQTMPLELTDPKPLHWDTIGRANINPSVFPLDFSKMKSEPYDVDGFKPLHSTTTSFDVAKLPVRAYTAEKDPEIPLKMEMEPLPVSLPSAKFQKPVRVTTSTMDLHNWQQINSANMQIYSIAKDSSGMLWLGGTKLIRFDGTSFTTVLSNVSITSLCFDKQGNLWFITTTGFKSTLNKLDIKHNLMGTAPVPFSVLSILVSGNVDHDGKIWFSSTNRSPLLKVDPVKMSYSTPGTNSGLVSARYYGCAFDRAGRVWLGSRNGIDIVDQKTKKIFHLGNENGVEDTVNAVTCGPDGRIWAVSYQQGSAKLLAINMENGKMIQYPLNFPPHTFYTRLKFDQAGNLWIASQNGMAILNLKENTIRYINQGKDLPFGTVIGIQEYNGNMLIADISFDSGSSALLEVAQNGQTANPFGNIQVVSMTEDSKKNLWIGMTDFLIVVDSSRQVYWRIGATNGLANKFIQNISEEAGEIVITTDGGYNIFDPEKNILSRISRREGLAADTVYNVMTDKSGNEWIAGSYAGIVKYEKQSGLVLQIKPEGGLNGVSVIQSMVVGDKIWVTTIEGGPNIIDPEKNTIRLIKHPEEINTAANKGIYLDSKGSIWLTGYPAWGLYNIDPVKKTLTRFTTSEGLSDNSTYSLLEYNGKMLVNSGQRIDMLTPPRLSPDDQWNVSPLLHTDMLKKAATTWMSDAVTKGGDYLWGDNGLVIVHGIQTDTSRGKDAITSLKIMDKETGFFSKNVSSSTDTGTQKKMISPASIGYTEKGEIRWDSLSGPFRLPVNLSLPYDQNVIQFGFTEFGSGRYDSLQFAYILQGQDKKWVITNDLSTQTYLNLSPGNYVFKVASKSRSGKWNTPATLSFSIRSPWYQTWWAYLLYVIVAVVLIRGYIVFRSRKLRKENKLLEEKVNQRTEELQQSYNNVEKLEEIGKKITSSLSVENIIGTVYKNVNTLMDASVFGIGLYNESLNRLEFPATYENGKKLSFYANSVDDKNRLSTTCFNSGKEILMGNVGEDHKEYLQQIPAPIAGEQAVSLIYLPLVAKGKKLGVITVQSFKPNAYSDYHVYMLRNIAIYTAIALENARSYEELKATQSQLIQSEKMASLGELTAGIAHEIQNPLNFVNNFSEINSELIDEMKNELNQGNVQDAIAIANDIRDNEKKINHHGKRADAIVKGMLQHSRSSNGQKEPTNINTLSDEYLRLAYHGLRAKDKSFNADMQTNFDESIPKINVVAQDVGRVILNLITNAFYAVKAAKPVKGENYQPTVWVSTERENGKIYVTVKDNGTGIPDSVKDKIFHPFFTTKPTGEGTGLGLSLSYDIIKAHNGEIKVESQEGQGTEFVVELPVT
jgi:C4-dicarboxylate-specific signal transduction histidine kinase/ligand-binding sensor domain-containing protein